MAVLSLRDVCKEYTNSKKNKTVALDHVNLEMKEGEFLAIMGPSGSGKTTLLNVASGIDSCQEGAIYINGMNIREMDKESRAIFRRNHIGVVFQDFNLLNSLTVRENILVPLILEMKEEDVDIKAAETYTKLLDIESIIENYPYEISGGQRQRVAICRALINNPAIIFADEPTGNLDTKSSETVMENFELLHSTYHASILLVTHDPHIASYCDRVVFLKDGCMAQEVVKEENRDFLEQIIGTLGVLSR